VIRFLGENAFHYIRRPLLSGLCQIITKLCNCREETEQIFAGQTKAIVAAGTAGTGEESTVVRFHRPWPLDGSEISAGYCITDSGNHRGELPAGPDMEDLAANWLKPVTTGYEVLRPAWHGSGSNYTRVTADAQSAAHCQLHLS
jgi:hypothetical protein